MPTFRVEKNRDYTVMSNYHLKDSNISLKAKGLLSQMLSLPESWCYTLSGLSHINKESIDAIRSAVRELEKHGYITRCQKRGEDGKLGKVEYTIYEQPRLNGDVIEPLLQKPVLENPTSDTPALGEATQLNTNRSKTKKLNTQESSIHPINPSAIHVRDKPLDSMDEMADVDSCRNMIMDNIEYGVLQERWGNERLDEVVELLLETVLSQCEYIRIAGGDYPREVVKSRMLKINAGHVEYVFACMKNNTSKIRNIKAYMLAALFNAPATMDSFYRAEANHDLFGMDY